MYLWKGADGTVLYVGKARNIRRRVRSYFGPQGRHGRLIARALEGVTAIDHEETGSELSALLREVALLRELRPPCNTRGLGGGRRYLKLTREPYPRLLVVPEPVDDGADYYGPLRSERHTRLAVDALEALYPIRSCHARCAGGAQARLLEEIPSECRGPCSAGHVDAYRQGIDDVRRLLDADQGTAVGALLTRLGDHVAADPAVVGMDRREAVEALIGLLGSLSRLRRAGSAGGVIVEPSTEYGAATALFVWHGRVVMQEHIWPEDWGRAAAAITRLAEVATTAATPLGSGELDAAMILHEWLTARADHPGVVSLRAGFDPVDALEAVRAAAAAMAVFQPEPRPAIDAGGFATAA